MESSTTSLALGLETSCGSGGLLALGRCRLQTQIRSSCEQRVAASAVTIPSPAIQSFRSVEKRLFVGATVLPATDILRGIDDAFIDPAIERPSADAKTLGLGGPRLAALSPMLD